MDINKNTILAFKDRFLEEFSQNVPNNIISTLSNMLAIDYEIRVSPSKSFKGDLNSYIERCCNKLKKFLGAKVIIDDSLSSALELFAIIIAGPKNEVKKGEENILQQEATISSLINMYFDDVKDPLLIDNISSSLKTLLSRPGKEELLNLIETDSKFISNLISETGSKLMNNEKNPVGISKFNSYLEASLAPILLKNAELHSKIERIKQTSSMLITAIATCGIIAASTLVADIVLPLTLLPATIASIKYAPSLGEKLGGMIANIDAGLKTSGRQIENMKLNILNHIKALPKDGVSLEQEIAKDLELSKQLSQDKIAKIEDHELEQINSTLKEKVSSITMNNTNNKIDTSKNKQKEKSRGVV